MTRAPDTPSVRWEANQHQMEKEPRKGRGRAVSNTHATGLRRPREPVGATGFSLVHGKTPIKHQKPFSLKKKRRWVEISLEKTS